MKAENRDFVYQVFRSSSQTIPRFDDIGKAAKLINESNTIGILAGASCRRSKDIVLELSNKLKAPITHTLRAADIFDHDTTNVVGLTGLIGNPSGYKAIMNCDLLLMLGTDFPYTNFLPESTKTIQIDIRPENIGNRTSVTMGLHGDIKETLEQLLPVCTQKLDDQFLVDLNNEFGKLKESNREKSDPSRDIEPLHPYIFARLVSDIASNDTIFSL